MEIAGLVITVAIALVALLAYRWRRKAHGVAEVREALLRLHAASNDGTSVFIRNHGIFNQDGRSAVHDLRLARLVLVDKKLSQLVARIDGLYLEAEKVAIQPAEVNVVELAARQFEAHQPAHELLRQLTDAITRASQLERRRAGTY